MSRSRQSILGEIPKSTANSAALNILREIPRDTANNAAHDIVSQIPKGTADCAPQKIVKQVPKDIVNGANQSVLKDILKVKSIGASQSDLREIPKDIANNVSQYIFKKLPRDTSKSQKQVKDESPGDEAKSMCKKTPQTIPTEPANDNGQKIPKEMKKDEASNMGQGNHRRMSRDKAKGAVQHIIPEIPTDTAYGDGQSILSEITKDTAFGAMQNILRNIPTDSTIGDRQTTISETPEDTDKTKEPSVHREIATETAKDAGETVLRKITKQASDVTGQSIPKETTKGPTDEEVESISNEALSGAGQSILRELHIDKCNDALESTYPELSHNHNVASKCPGACHKDSDNFWQKFGFLLAPAFLSALCFGRSVQGEFVHDDVWAILNNPDSRGDTPVSSIFSNDFWGKGMSDNSSHKSYRPLCVLSFRLNVFFWGMEPFYFHAVNVFLHCLVSSLLMFTCHKVVFKDRILALAAALLFSAHPIHTEAVAGIVGRADVLSCLLFLLSFLSYIRSVEVWSSEDRVPSTTSPLFLVLSLVLGTCAMLVKETGVTVFGVCLIYDLLCLCPKRLKRPLSSDQAKPMWYVASPFLKRAALVSCHATVVLYFRLRIMGGSMPLFSEQDNPASFSPYILTRLLTHSYLLAFNAWLMLAPMTLCYDWQVGSIPLIHSMWDERNMATFLLLMILVSLGWHCLSVSKRMEHRELLVGLLFLIFPFIPASNLFFRVGFVVAERVLYMPSMGFCILCVQGLKTLHSRTSQRRSSALTSCFLVLLILYSWKTVTQSECWKSREALFRSGVQTLPHNAKVHYNYANFLKDQNRKDEAINHYKTVLRLYPQHPSALNNLGTLTSNTTAAEEYYRRALNISPQHSRALFNLGNLLRTLGRDDEAEILLKESLSHGPYFADAYSSLGSLLTDQKRHKEAEEIYQDGIKNCADSSDLQNNYGVFLVDVGSPQKAVTHYLHALKLRPDHHVAMLNLGRLHRSIGQNVEAERWYKKALQISRDPDVISPLGALYYNTGQYNEALVLYQEAVGLHPGNLQLHLSLAQVLIVMNQLVEAESLIVQMAEEFSDCTECYRLLSAIYSKEENYPKALEMIDAALQMKPKDAKILSELHFARGNQLRELNQLEEAFQSYMNVADLMPSQAQAWMNMGGIKHIQGDYSSARSFYKKALLLDPNSKLLKENLAKLHRLENKIQTGKGNDPDPESGHQRLSEPERAPGRV
ncbi:protein O-mannosyl-transferase TMTC1 [Bombina bombina]|uniref:protein O-mannosyl-transferase TMTC1 n=1 Tax=Bombina bombina TaxID=8345 RepID=UPI00235AC500|nr:protein O-mannosyl-transferase TMTC1 [Bombina bombina]